MDNVKISITNPTSYINEEHIHLFDSTEEMDTYSAVEFYRIFYNE